MSDKLLTEISSVLKEQKVILTDKVMQMHFQEQPGLKQRYSAWDLAQYRNDCGYHIDFLTQCIAYQSPMLYADYLVWVEQLFWHLRIPAESITVFFKCFNAVLATEFDPQGKLGLLAYLNLANIGLTDHNYDNVSYIDETKPYGKEAGYLLSLLLAGNKAKASLHIMNLVSQGLSIKDCYLHIFQPMQYEVGRLWHTHQISVAQEHFVTSAAQLIMSQFYPQIFNHEKTGKSMVATCISGEQHEIGLRMVTDLMEIDGWDTHFLGANTPIDNIPDILIAKKAELLAVSITLSTQLSNLEKLISILRQRIPHVKILVGGYPLNLDDKLWQRLGADGFGRDATQAIQVANDLIAGNDG